MDPLQKTIILPLFGYAVPFHIDTIKDVQKTIENGYNCLRINFLSPKVTRKESNYMSHRFIKI